jgi:hypothetical protein
MTKTEHNSLRLRYQILQNLLFSPKILKGHRTTAAHIRDEKNKKCIYSIACGVGVFVTDSMEIF